MLGGLNTELDLCDCIGMTLSCKLYGCRWLKQKSTNFWTGERCRGWSWRSEKLYSVNLLFSHFQCVKAMLVWWKFLERWWACWTIFSDVAGNSSRKCQQVRFDVPALWG